MRRPHDPLALRPTIDALEALASEHRRLEASSARTLTAFDDALRASRRFADETEAMTLRSRLAARGLPVPAC